MKKQVYLNINREQGAVIPLIALCTILFFILAAMVIDLTLLASSREQSQHFARLAALAALEAHFAVPGNPSITERVQAALDRAREVSQLNVLLSDKDKQRQVNAEVDPGTGAALEPGMYYFADDGTAPCSAIGDGSYPCFVSADLSDPDTRITAYRISGSFYAGISTTLARAVLGKETFSVDVWATATVIPRHGCFLVDLSGSMGRETHPLKTIAMQQNTPRTGRGGELGFLLEGENNSIAEDYYHTEFWNFLCTGDQNLSSNTCTGQSRPTNDGEWQTFLGTPLSDLTKQEYSRIHFHDDYVHKLTLGDKHWGQRQDYQDHHPDPSTNPQYEVVADGSVADSGKWYYVDTYRDADGSDGYTYGGAEPLRTVFAGLRTAIQKFKNRQVAGDQACLIMYDNKLSWPRVVKLTDDFDYLLKLTDFSANGTISSDDPAILDADLTSVGTSGLELLIRHNMFPGGASSNFTNTIQAISEAMTQLTEGNPDGGFSSDFIVAIGDGLNNCQTCSSGSCTAGCQNLYGNYKQSQRDLIGTVSGTIQGKNIPLHWILVGSNVAPHTLDITLEPDPNTGLGPCASDVEIRRLGKAFVLGGDENGDPYPDDATWQSAWENMGNAPFYQANADAYELSWGTRGIWGPIRSTPCTDPANPPLCSGSIDDANPKRMFVDPQCRSEEEQINAYMEKIIGDNPYTLVEVEGLGKP